MYLVQMDGCSSIVDCHGRYAVHDTRCLFPEVQDISLKHDSSTMLHGCPRVQERPPATCICKISVCGDIG